LDEPEWRSAASWLEAVVREERRGELLLAFDLAERGLAQHPDDVALKHRAVLALARAGDTDQAARHFERYELAVVPDEDVAALRARLAKDLALAADGAERRRGAADAAELYGAIFARTRGYYPGINAATLSLVAGDAERARRLAADVLELIPPEDDSYYAAATVGEAQLLLGDEDAVRAALEQAASRHGGDYGALATTRRQLRLVASLVGADPALLGVLAGPSVAHFCGHRISGAEGARFPDQAEVAVAAAIAEEVARYPTGYAYGALAGGADIMWAEALLARGCELHVVLPFALREFVATSVESCGPGWTDRFHRCLEAATAVLYATDDAFLGDDVLFRYGSELAMGLALLRARYLDAEAHQFAVWDGGPALGQAGTAIDVATWRRSGNPVVIVSPRPADDAVGPAGKPSADSSGREVRALVFGDVRGFSKLTDEQLPIFSTRVLGGFADVVRRHGDDVLHRNTWGDAVYLVLADAAAAAACALDLQEAMAAIDLERAGLPAHLALRLGAHLGPVFATRDPVLEAPAFMGSHVSRTARIEPVTPAGTVYVTEAFAAALVLDGSRDYACDYVGHMPAAKDFGLLRMYRLRRDEGGTAP
jgi:tetratricopeptide (TPR) repeat protein